MEVKVVLIILGVLAFVATGLLIGKRDYDKRKHPPQA